MIHCRQCGSQVPEPDQFCPNCGQGVNPTTSVPTNHIAPLAENSVLEGRYVITRAISRSSYNLYDGILRESGMPVVIEERMMGRLKTVRLDEGGQAAEGLKPNIEINQPQGMSRGISFKQEYDILAGLSHNGHKAYTDYFHSHEREYLVREMSAGKSLATLATNQSLDESAAIEIALQLCQLAGELHKMGYLHLGIDPDCVTWTGKEASLSNFSRAVPQNRRRPYYLTNDFSAPELMLVDGIMVETAADIFSIGAVLYWLLTGEKPSITGSSLTTILGQVKSPGLARILSNCLQNDVPLRIKTADALATQLQAYIKSGKSPSRYEAAAYTDMGMVRPNNEDSCLMLECTRHTDGREIDYGIYIIADGMGGHSAGEVASARAIDKIGSSLFNALTVADRNISYSEIIRQAVESANTDIYALSRSSPALHSMGSTLTLGLRVDSDLYIGHLGDSRCYLVRNGQIRQLTEDHSVVAGLIKRGIINEEQARIHPDRGRILRSLGSPGTVMVDSLEATGHGAKLSLQAPDVLIFCTDGVTDELSGSDLLSLIDIRDKADIICQKLINEANHRGGNDNCTVIVVKVMNAP